ncbi:hypothetical protein N7457_004334 [Penicillium paradoxum]|uniref:uncharacterized protein n=1 Tax=Penicillium paradoxum TaxID=176176 RepID=UPI0025476DEA|nr:uncharacterized protein N7457_004334 [Penicillium paradoxum]KAJ5782560.1 hypothetical protein N7457_004334 [Penicillium paradoxum]
MASGGLVDIHTACTSRGNFNVLGVVVDTLPLYRTRGSSACITFTIKDTDFDGPTWQGGLKVKYFNDDDSCLPNVRVNDVVLLHNIRVTIYQNKPTGVVSQQDSVLWAVFRPDPNPSSSPFITCGPVHWEPTLKEKDQAQSLLDRVSPGVSSVQPTTSRSAPAFTRPQHVQAAPSATKYGGLPYINIEAAKPRLLCQLLGQVVQLYTLDSEKCTLHMTDYTANGDLTNHKKPGDDDEDSGPEGDRFGYVSKKKDWPGPWGKLTIQVTLWEPHATYAREHLKPGDIALLTYVRIKETRGLEAAVHEDRRDPEKIHVHIVHDDNDERVQALMERRAQYWKIHGEPKADTKKPKKRNKKAEQKKEVRKEEGQLLLPAVSRIKMNPNEQCSGGIVYQLPFQNVNYRSQLRVVDFFPPMIEDFAVQRSSSSPVFSGQSHGSNPKYGWEWRFCLLVEGVEPKASEELPRQVTKLYVCGQDGDCLLNDDAIDLRSNSKKATEIKEKLFILWGDLEEKKSKARASGQQSWGQVRSRPFECCIKEYGVRCTHSKDPNAMDIDGDVCSYPGCFGWERRFAMFGTTIHT